MIGNSFPEYLFIRTSITALRLVAPASILYLGISTWNAAFLFSPWLKAAAIAEAGFFLVFYLPRKKRLQAPPSQLPTPLTKQQRQHFFEKCSSHLEFIRHSLHPPYPSGWFLPWNEEFQREDAIDWLLWSLFACERRHAKLDEWEEELDGYIQIIEKMLGRKLQAGRGNGVKSIRLTFDPVQVAHRPLIWYMIVAFVDTRTSIRLALLGFQHFSSWKWFQMFPPRAISMFSQPTAIPLGILLPYWYRPHTSKTKLPIVFIHGIGIGLYPYISFIREIIALDPDVGILLVELPTFSMHITTSPIAPRTHILKALDSILTSLHISRFVLASHSYGTFLSAYLLRPPTTSSNGTNHGKNHTAPSYGTFPIDATSELDPLQDPDETLLHTALASKVAHALLIDPIPILLHLHSVAYNFLYRHPRSAAEWQLWYFASRDADVARSLHKAFFWEQGCLWSDDLVRFVRGGGDGDGDAGGRRLAVALAGKDQIVPAETVRAYLTGESQPSARWVGRARSPLSCADGTCSPLFQFDKVDEEGGGAAEAKGDLEVLFYPELDHATVFDTAERRRPILDTLARFVND